MTTKTPSKKRILETFELSKETRQTLVSLKRKTRWTKKEIVERAIKLAATSPQFFNLV